ncbi:MAG: tRNA (adenosine(37)-N6)-dimethylallyltransferase MiaA [Pseudomonadota bacterium]
MSPQDRVPIVIVAGPTASGKSAAALALAKHLNGEIICADSMQVYSDLHLLSARPSARDEAQAPHHLYGHVDGSERYSAGRFAREASAVVGEVRKRGRVPILCGGTGLYLAAMTEGLSPIPDIPPEVMDDLNRVWNGDAEAFRDHLLTLDPEMERLEPQDQQRHVRAAAVYEVTGQPLSYWQTVAPIRLTPGPFLPVVLSPDRAQLYARCEARFDRMIEAGALAEVETLKARGLSDQLPVMKALGVPELLAHLAGMCSWDDTVTSAKQETRRFAKRQLTWFRNQTDWKTFEAPAELIGYVASTIGRL